MNDGKLYLILLDELTTLLKDASIVEVEDYVVRVAASSSPILDEKKDLVMRVLRSIYEDKVNKNRAPDILAMIRARYGDKGDSQDDV